MLAYVTKSSEACAHHRCRSDGDSLCTGDCVQREKKTDPFFNKAFICFCSFNKAFILKWALLCHFPAPAVRPLWSQVPVRLIKENVNPPSELNSGFQQL